MVYPNGTIGPSDDTWILDAVNRYMCTDNAPLRHEDKEVFLMEKVGDAAIHSLRGD
jgi:hypothetical protein